MVLSLMLYAAKGVTQNLVKNPSFEQFNDCPKRLGNFNADVVHWSTPSGGSTDYFNACSTSMGTPENFNGKQPADFGKGYAGLYLYAPDDYREYIQAELSETLIKGKKYRVSFYVSLAERSDFAVKEFGVLFAKDQISLKSKTEISKKKRYQLRTNAYNFMEIGYSNFFSDTKDWILVYTQFVAKGTENYLIMGNFKTNVRTRMFKTKKDAKQGAYYYVDMFRVEAVRQPSKSDLAQPEEFTLDETHTFKNLLFEFDRFNLLTAAQKEVKQLFKYVKDDKSLQIAIKGHTDAVGSDRYNLALSRKRAQAVADYLHALGLSKDRILWKGLGGQKPIATNDTEAGRRQNRRVEFVISKTTH